MAINAGANDKDRGDDLRSTLFLGSRFGALYDGLENHHKPPSCQQEHYGKLKRHHEAGDIDCPETKSAAFLQSLQRASKYSALIVLICTL